MSYSISATATPEKEGKIIFNETSASFGITTGSDQELPSPADVFLGALAACILKNVQRFSGMMKFEYQEANVTVSATYAQKPSRLENITYELVILSSEEKINTPLLKRNLSKFGTIYNMIAKATKVAGTVTHNRI
ncbi:MAG TPA: osmotically inducible protein C [Flavobacteriaceae bacterium]|jgi:uncharacterized OsmC-like protein|nr:osmotically inducible protein C [Flavobacteriaceae bacterium]MAY52781.1 osmotically inducible protein C [Flavobacteriaceae bacterium]HBR55115.1 osmotically inducible protein C [Flavobacteriaceae bacterium]|tara:strand:+ start:312 stop:716 length:405 start_codon:yes stop_codon:yes gene_type:complete